MELLEQIVRAGVVGLGGAGFPTGKKLDCRVEGPSASRFCGPTAT